MEETPTTGRGSLIANMPLIFSGIALIASLASPAIGQYADGQVAASKFAALEKRVEKLEDYQERTSHRLTELTILYTKSDGRLNGIEKSMAGFARFLDKWTK